MQRQGFSLVELSIVLVILGLLTGGILAGQSLIRASELRAVTSEYSRYTAAINTFRDKFFALPGDFTATTTGLPSATWIGQGDSDGLVETTGTATSNEISLFWIHLAAAGLIEGSYTNVANTTFTAGTHNPKSKLGNAAWNVGNLGTVLAASTTYYEGNYGNVFYFGSGTSATTPGAILKAEEAWNIDTKLDDARPQTGLVTSLESLGSATAGAGCVNVAASSSATTATAYDLAGTGTTCSIVIKTGS